MNTRKKKCENFNFAKKNEIWEIQIKNDEKMREFVQYASGQTESVSIYQLNEFEKKQ